MKASMPSMTYLNWFQLYSWLKRILLFIIFLHNCLLLALVISILFNTWYWLSYKLWYFDRQDIDMPSLLLWCLTVKVTTNRNICFLLDILFASPDLLSTILQAGLALGNWSLWIKSTCSHDLFADHLSAC